MANNKALCKDNINVEQLKHVPKEIYKEIGYILHEIYERSDTEINLGTGILLPLLKQKKTQGPVKSLIPVTLVEVIQKILSKIFMDRTEDTINTEYIQKIQKHHRCTMGPQVDDS